MTQQIRWTTQERRHIALSVMEGLKIKPSASVVKLIQESQKDFPESRKRKINTVLLVPWLEDEISTIKRELAAAEKIELERKEAEIEKLKVNADVFESLATKIEPAIHHQNGIKELNVEGLTTETLLIELIKRLSVQLTPVFEKVVLNTVNSQLEQAMTKVMSDYLKSLGLVDKNKPKKMHILLVGLVPTQFNEIEKEFGEFFDLRLWATHENINKLKSMSANVERIYAMTNFMSHAQKDVIMSVNPEAYIPFTGGISTLKDMLEHLYASI